MLKYSDYDIVFQEVPNELTLAVNVSNCPNRCKGCHSTYLWEDVGEPLTEKVLAQLCERYSNGLTCVAFMGGDAEPFEVANLAHYVRTELHLKTAWYSGRDNLPERFPATEFHFIKVGSYRSELGGLKSPTTNQRMYKILLDGGKEDITSIFWKEYR